MKKIEIYKSMTPLHKQFVWIMIGFVMFFLIFPLLITKGFVLYLPFTILTGLVIQQTNMLFKINEKWLKNGVKDERDN